jgi:hypothetical protein
LYPIISWQRFGFFKPLRRETYYKNLNYYIMKKINILASDGCIFSDEDSVDIIRGQVSDQKSQGKSLDETKEYVLNYNDFGEGNTNDSTEIKELVTIFFRNKDL